MRAGARDPAGMAVAPVGAFHDVATLTFKVANAFMFLTELFVA
jgi:hypothetical protein